MPKTENRVLVFSLDRASLSVVVSEDCGREIKENRENRERNRVDRILGYFSNPFLDVGYITVPDNV